MTPISGWATAGNRELGDISFEGLERLWIAAAQAAAEPSCSGYLVERLADQQVTLEAAAAAISHVSSPYSALDSPAEILLAAMSRWRVYRDVSKVSVDLQLLVGETSPRWSPTGWIEEDDALAAGAALGQGTAAILADALNSISAAKSSAYLAPVIRSIEETAAAVESCVRDDFRDVGLHVEAGLAWILDPLSSLHTCAVMTEKAITDEQLGDRRASTVTRRWAYARVRPHTVEGLSGQHVEKSKMLVAGLAIV